MLSGHPHPLLSVIIPARNEQGNIVRTLKALSRCHLSGFIEVLLMDNGSTDATVKEAEGFQRLLNLHIEVHPELTIGGLRNRGAALAKSPALAFVDADCEVAEDWVESALESLRREGGIVGAPYSSSEDASWVAAVWTRHEARRPNGRISFVPGGNLIVSAQDFQRVGGFDDTLHSNEDFEFCRRAALCGITVTACATQAHHFGAPQTLAELWTQQRWHGGDVLHVYLRNVRRGWNLRPVAYAAYMLIGLVLLALSLSAGVLTGWWTGAVVVAAGLFVAPVALSLRSAASGGRWKDAAPLALLFFVYGCARAVCLMWPRAIADKLRHPIFRNATALYAQQVANYVLPVILIPYLARVLRPDAWGMVVFAQGFAIWLSRILEYGFNLSATRDIARSRADRTKVGEIAGGVIGAQLLLVLGAGLLAAAAGVAAPSFRDYPHYLLLAWAVSLTQGLNPLWFYQGMEDMRLPAALSVGGRVIGTVGVFVFVREPGDGWMVLVLQLISGIASTGAALWVMHRRVPVVGLSVSGAWKTLSEGWRIFLLRGSITLYSTANTFLLGLFVPTSVVAFYGGADRITRACYDCLSPISQALFPHMAHLAATDRKRAGEVARLSFYVLAGLGLAACGALFLLAPWIVLLLLGKEYSAAVPVLRILCFVPLLASVSNLLGVQWMVPFGFERQMTRVLIAAALANIALVPFLAPRFGAVGMAVSVVVAEATVTFGMYFTLRLLGHDPFTRTEPAQAPVAPQSPVRA